MMRSVRGSSVAVLFFAAAVGAGCAQSDAGITTRVRAKLDAQRDVPTGTITVNTANRVVTLSGTAGSEAEKQKVVQLAKSTEGVKGVVDNLAVNPSAAPPPAPAAPAAPAPASSS